MSDKNSRLYISAAKDLWQYQLHRNDTTWHIQDIIILRDITNWFELTKILMDEIK